RKIQLGNEKSSKAAGTSGKAAGKSTKVQTTLQEMFKTCDSLVKGLNRVFRSHNVPEELKKSRKLVIKLGMKIQNARKPFERLLPLMIKINSTIGKLNTVLNQRNPVQTISKNLQEAMNFRDQMNLNIQNIVNLWKNGDGTRPMSKFLQEAQNFRYQTETAINVASEQQKGITSWVSMFNTSVYQLRK
ncbi:hypothetical protein EWB00_010017, partial [Schistosoma japonicum]